MLKVNNFEIEFSGLDEGLNVYINRLNNYIKSDKDNFAMLCRLVYEIKQWFSDEKYSSFLCDEFHRSFDKLGIDGVYYNYNKLMKSFGFSKTEYTNLLKCFERYVECSDVGTKLQDRFFAFSKSQLFELNVLDIEIVKKDIEDCILYPSMTIKKLREYIKMRKLNIDQREDKLKEEEIPDPYDPKKYYSFSYFEKLSKGQLLNVLMTLQDYCKSLVDKSRKKKN